MENLLLAVVLGAMALVPLCEIVLRATLGVGISGAASFTQHFVLAAGMLGAAIAAREGRLIALVVPGTQATGPVAARTRALAGVVAVVVTALLFAASIDFVLAERAGGSVIAYGIPVWAGQAVLPLGYALIGLRLARAAAPGWPARVALIALALAVGAAAVLGAPLHGALAAAAIGLVLAAALLGAPVYAAIGGVALLLFWSDGLPIASLPLDHYRLVVNPSLPMIPLFALAGYFLAEGGAPRRLIRVFDAFFGASRGGAALVTVLACAFFTSFSGASGVTIVALGGMLMPLLLRAGYAHRSALGLLAASGSIGGLLPPGLPLVLYAIVARIPIRDMFLAGILPALLMLALVGAWGMRRAPRTHVARPPIDWREARAALLDAKWELALPPVAFLGLFTGLATPVEAAALTAAYAFVVEVFITRDLGLRRDVPRVMAECGLLVGGILLILGVALGLSNYLVDARVPERAADWAAGALGSRWMFLLALNLCLLAAGCLLDMFSAIVVLVPLVLPIGLAFGVDPIHLGIVFLVNLELGYLTPPVGMNLYFTASRFGRPLPEVLRAALPAAGVFALGVLLVTALPWLATGLPRLFGSQS
ncbi:MAG TPA: TRAP transporter large permease subunit [Burkholderiales bacterium]|nr:TRAP transporter large permease subunit [Burkholderiales bacterium]